MMTKTEIKTPEQIVRGYSNLSNVEQQLRAQGMIGIGTTDGIRYKLYREALELGYPKKWFKYLWSVLIHGKHVTDQLNFLTKVDRGLPSQYHYCNSSYT
jgi:hypothetical protein